MAGLTVHLNGLQPDHLLSGISLIGREHSSEDHCLDPAVVRRHKFFFSPPMRDRLYGDLPCRLPRRQRDLVIASKTSAVHADVLQASHPFACSAFRERGWRRLRFCVRLAS